ncbi:hypothetical protein [Rhodovulum strictum]|uniref:Uncharacterized protein n=1 Tax=Rhodovulum strictum TaxID=58314 RepID=A0A844B3C4_9RHOB|nr:hypothetical protein [Rhodovulum strictum]MRH20240.1 hypothetical protein [Rhodovulum strictum]
MRIETADPKGLIREAYRIEGIGPEECRSIFLDWALSLPEGAGTRSALKRLLAEYGGAAPAHPMTAVLRAGLDDQPPPRRRGGARGRRS